MLETMDNMDLCIFGRCGYRQSRSLKMVSKGVLQVVFGTVITRGPRSPLAQSAMAELEQACLLFAKASVYNIRATKALVSLQP